MASHKKQHSVAQSYLKVWCDPKTPSGQEPYVWRFKKDSVHVVEAASKALVM
jgi:hypothetical protein